MEILDPIFANLVAEVLEAADYTIFFDARPQKPRPACVFMAERRSEDGKRGFHVTVFHVGGTWSYTVWWFIGNRLQPRQSRGFKAPGDLRLQLDEMWKGPAPTP